MEAVTAAFVYASRFTEKLELPDFIRDAIGKLRLVPAAYRPNRAPARPRNRRPEANSNWREKVLVDFVRRIREVEDADYDRVFEIFNKVASATVGLLSTQAIEVLRTRDEQFRLRITTLLFDKAISQSFYAQVMADMAVQLTKEFPAIADDLDAHVKMFPTVYDMNTTILYPTTDDAEYSEKVIAWAKQKDKRRGFARFLTHLYVRELVPAESLHSAIGSVLVDLETTAQGEKTQQSEENVTQFADFLYETAKLLPPTAVELRGLLSTKIGSLLKVTRTSVPCITMRSRFKLEDTLKCVQ